MKRIKIFLLVTMIICVLCSCGSAPLPKPEDRVNDFCSAMQQFDIEKMQSCLVFPDPNFEPKLESDIGIAPVVSQVKEWAKKIQYAIIEKEVDDSKADFVVKFSYVDASAAGEKVMDDIIAYTFSSILNPVSESEASQMEKVMSDAISSTPVGNSQKDVRFSLSKVDGEWKITKLPDAIISILEADFTKSIDILGDLFSQTPDSSSSGVSSAMSSIMERDPSSPTGFSKQFLTQKGDEAYKASQHGEKHDKTLVWLSDIEDWYDADSDCYLWFNAEFSVWQYWYEGISSDYGDYGWMEHDDDGWYIEASEGNWIKLPRQYDTGRLWYIDRNN